MFSCLSHAATSLSTTCSSPSARANGFAIGHKSFRDAIFTSKLPECPEGAEAAFLLFDYAAESGNALPALALGRYYDPGDSGPSGSIRKGPVIANEWHQAALAGGQKEAEDHLVEL